MAALNDCAAGQGVGSKLAPPSNAVYSQLLATTREELPSGQILCVPLRKPRRLSAIMWTLEHPFAFGQLRGLYG
jgi:hypothetical protein